MLLLFLCISNIVMLLVIYGCLNGLFIAVSILEGLALLRFMCSFVKALIRFGISLLTRIFCSVIISSLFFEFN